MASRGARPKPAALRLVDGTHRTTRHGDADKVREVAEAGEARFGKLRKPAGMRGEALKAWRDFIEPAWWLDGSKGMAAIALCELWQEFRFTGTAFPASKHGQMRAYMAELGLTDERNRTGEPPAVKDEFDD